MSTIGGHSQHCDRELFKPQEPWCPPERLLQLYSLRSQVGFGCIRHSLTAPYLHCGNLPGVGVGFSELPKDRTTF